MKRKILSVLLTVGLPVSLLLTAAEARHYEVLADRQS